MEKINIVIDQRIVMINRVKYNLVLAIGMLFMPLSAGEITVKIDDVRSYGRFVQDIDNFLLDSSVLIEAEKIRKKLEGGEKITEMEQMHSHVDVVKVHQKNFVSRHEMLNNYQVFLNEEVMLEILLHYIEVKENHEKALVLLLSERILPKKYFAKLIGILRVNMRELNVNGWNQVTVMPSLRDDKLSFIEVNMAKYFNIKQNLLKIAK